MSELSTTPVIPGSNSSDNLPETQLKNPTDSKCIPIVKKILLGLVIALSITAVIGLSLLLAGVPIVVLGVAVAAIAAGCGASSTVVASIALGLFALIGIGATAYGCYEKKQSIDLTDNLLDTFTTAEGVTLVPYSILDDSELPNEEEIEELESDSESALSDYEDSSSLNSNNSSSLNSNNSLSLNSDNSLSNDDDTLLDVDFDTNIVSDFVL